MKRNLRSSRADSFSRSCFFLQDLRRRSIVPTVALHSARSFFVTSLIREKSLLGFGKPKVRKTPSLSSLPGNDTTSEREAVPPCRFTFSGFVAHCSVGASDCLSGVKDSDDSPSYLQHYINRR